MPSFPDLDEPLIDNEVRVRLAAEYDIPEVLIAYQDDSELHVRMGEPRPPSGAELGRLAERGADDRSAGVGITLTIVGSGSDVCLGQVNVHRVNWENARAELGIWVAPGARGRGLARTALRLVAAWLLQDLGFQRVQLLSEPGNEWLIRAATGAGFQREGVLKGFLRGQGARVDVVMLSLVRSDLTG
ncbi:MAG TPA: GNAT family protein [Solirubrobacteraceae bacterium]|jgi:RimJ/RimL family protein N-acetyltransferase